MWMLNVLGPVTLRTSPEGETVALGRKSRAALAWLAAKDGSATRSELLDLLWQDRPEGDARNALRQWLFQINRSAGGARMVEARGELLQLDRSLCDVDLWRSRRHAASPTAGDWLAACELHEREFAQGLSITPEFDAWASAERQGQIHRLAILVDRLAGAALGPDAIERAATVARSLLARDPLQEGCWVALIRLYVAAGWRAKARQAWTECRRILRVEGGTEPSERTRARVGELIETPPSAYVQRSAERRPREIVRPDDAEAAAVDHVLRGWTHYYSGSAAANALAREAFQQAAALQPSRPEYRVFSAWTRFTDFNYAWNGSPGGNYLRAAAEARELMQRHPQEPFCHALHAKLLTWRGEFEAASDAYAVSLRTAPEVASIWSNAAEALMRAGRLDDALEHVAQAIALEPGNRGPFHTVLGMILFARGELEASLEAFQTALRRNPAYCVAAGGVAAACGELGRTDEAWQAALHGQMLRNGLGHALHVLGPLAEPRLKDRWLAAWLRAGMSESQTAARVIPFTQHS